MTEEKKINECTDIQRFHSVETYTFCKENGRWCVHFPGAVEMGWRKEDLELVEGASKLLHAVAGGQNEVRMRICNQPFDGADVLTIVEHCPAPKGGANCLMTRCNGRAFNKILWICDIALLIFGDMPEHIYLQRVNR